jgi:hypothetical protein
MAKPRLLKLSGKGSRRSTAHRKLRAGEGALIFTGTAKENLALRTIMPVAIFGEAVQTANVALKLNFSALTLLESHECPSFDGCRGKSEDTRSGEGLIGFSKTACYCGGVITVLLL